MNANGRITVVDDDPSILELMKALLESEGYDVQAFDSAPSALKAVLAEPPDLAVLDMMMPSMTGLDLLKAFRGHSDTRHLPVIVCSAYYETLRRTIRELGRDNVGYIRKPFQISDLVEMISGMIAESAPLSRTRSDRKAARGEGLRLAS